MNKRYKKEAGENLTVWGERLSKAIITDKLSQTEIFEVLNEVSKESYFEGVFVERELNKKFNEIEEQKNELTRYRV